MSYEDEYRSCRRKVRLQTLLTLFLLFFFLLNIAGLFAGAVFYYEFCVANTRVGLARFQNLRDELEKGKQTRHWEDVAIQSRFGYPLQGTYLPSPAPSDKTVIFLHGIAGSRAAGLWYAGIYRDAGYNVLLYDARAQGDSGGPSVTWGYYEQYDLDQWVSWLEARHPGGIIGVHGVSMGAATALLHARLNESSHRVRFYVADSAYADLEDLLTQQIDAALHWPNPLLVLALLKYSSAYAYLESRFFYEQVSPLRALRQVTTPILFLHGEADPLVPVPMCWQLYTAAQGPRAIHTFPGTGHAMAIFDHKAEYRRQIHQFLHTVTTPAGS